MMSVIDVDADLGNADWIKPRFRAAGGPGSGNFGHAGRPGKVGGSASGESKLTSYKQQTAIGQIMQGEVRSVNLDGVDPYETGHEDHFEYEVWASKRFRYNHGHIEWLDTPTDDDYFAVENYYEDRGWHIDRQQLQVTGRVLPRPEPRMAEYRTAKETPGKKYGSMTMRFDVKTDRAINWAKRHAAELVTNVSKTTKQEIKDAIVRAFQQGTLRSAYKDILAVVGDKARATTIARTESMRAANAGQREAWYQARSKGIISKSARRVWIYTDDGAACDECADLDGETATLRGKYPGDGDDGPPLHPRCRCTEGLVANDEFEEDEEDDEDEE